MGFDLAGRSVVVTGAARGIGLAVARAAAREGARLVLTDRDGPALDLAATGLATDVLTLVADLADPQAPACIAEAARDRFGGIEGLVHAAGLTTRGSFLTGTAALWDDLFAVNARAGFLLMQQTILDLRARRAPGSIVNILSMNAHCGIPELAIYSASKGALATLTKNAAQAHMADRIRANGIMLGWVATPSERQMQADTLGKGPGWEAEAAAGLPLGRLVTAEECAELAVFLLSDRSIPMSGALIDFDQKVAGAI